MSITAIIIAAVIVGGTGLFIGIIPWDLPARNLQLK